MVIVIRYICIGILLINIASYIADLRRYFAKSDVSRQLRRRISVLEVVANNDYYFWELIVIQLFEHLIVITPSLLLIINAGEHAMLFITSVIYLIFASLIRVSSVLFYSKTNQAHKVDRKKIYQSYTIHDDKVVISHNFGNNLLMVLSSITYLVIPLYQLWVFLGL